MCTELKSGAKSVTRCQERGWVRISSTCSPCTCCPGADGLQSPVGFRMAPIWGQFSFVSS